MASIDPYAPCPCGSGQKYKWCCQNGESYADRSHRQLRNGQVAAALETLDEGLRKLPGNAWLGLRKAGILAEQGRLAEARPMLEALVAKHPGQLNAQSILVQIVLQEETVDAAVAQLQRALSACPADRRKDLRPIVQLVGMGLAQVRETFSARKHLELALALTAKDQAYDPAREALGRLEGNSDASAWLRNPEVLAPPPEGLRADQRERFVQAAGWAEEGLWSAAASAFDTLAADGVPAAERNGGLCRLWLIEDAAGVTSLRRYHARLGETEEAVDLEALCQEVEPPRPDDYVDHVHLIWQIRDRKRLEETLKGAREVQDLGRAKLEEGDASFEVDHYQLLDRPRPEGDALPENVRDLPRIMADIFVGQEHVMLDAYDDGTLNDVRNRFTDLAVPAIPPAHPKTKDLGRVAREILALTLEVWQPPQADPAAMGRLMLQERERVLLEVWPETPLTFLRGRTPRQAAKAGNARVALRAAVCRIEMANLAPTIVGDAASRLRAELGIPDEPAIDPQTVQIDQVHIARLHRIPADRLDDERLVALYHRARRFGMTTALESASRLLVDRLDRLDEQTVPRLPLFGGLAELALKRGDRTEAFRWLERGRQVDPRSRGEAAVHWDMTTLRVQAMAEPPETWVPQLARLLSRYMGDQATNVPMLTYLAHMGLIRLGVDEKDPSRILVDDRAIQALMAQYGPKIAAPGGAVGEIWTPGATTGGATTPSGLWTPGSATASPGGDKPKLIIPGR